MTEKPILLVEDDPDIQQSLRLFLEIEGFSAHYVSHGKEALEFLKSGKGVSLILLDLMMPVMDGYEFLEELRSQKSIAFNTIPVILLSAASDLEKTAHRFQVEYVRKPINLDRLLEIIRKHQHQH